MAYFFVKDKPKYKRGLQYQHNLLIGQKISGKYFICKIRIVKNELHRYLDHGCRVECFNNISLLLIYRDNTKYLSKQNKHICNKRNRSSIRRNIYYWSLPFKAESNKCIVQKIIDWIASYHKVSDMAIFFLLSGDEKHVSHYKQIKVVPSI